jgi:pimeloyl-ACP methyl ester carboxylesterase
MASKHFVTSGGTDTHYIVAGGDNGRLVILLHGLGGSADTFDDLVPLLPQTDKTVAVDLEGFGKTPLNPGRPLSFPNYVADLHDLITHEQQARHSGGSHQKILLIGHSLGGIVSLHYACTYPTQVAGLMVLGVGQSVRNIPPAQQRMRDLAATARQRGMGAVAEVAVKMNLPDAASADQKERVRAAVASCDAEAYAQTAEAVAGDDHVDPDYGSIACPCVFVAGDADVLSPVQRAEDLAPLVGGGRVQVSVVKSGHQMILQDLDGVKRALETLLATQNQS